MNVNKIGGRSLSDYPKTSNLIGENKLEIRSSRNNFVVNMRIAQIKHRNEMQGHHKSRPNLNEYFTI